MGPTEYSTQKNECTSCSAIPSKWKSGIFFVIPTLKRKYVYDLGYVYTGPDRNRSEANRTGTASVYTRRLWKRSGTDPKLDLRKKQVYILDPFGSVPDRFLNDPV